ncbi:hypothetical protein [Nodularia spumigena]|uniref:hypothetical protein n=1 Tax=Nodularia spumigena TaxID=70799 RepID=UPI002330D9B5|nr:hypothetical protein [Nodularia spumigena]MDB9499530.1 hypothetical protein [Nodularia spumigena CS-336/02]
MNKGLQDKSYIYNHDCFYLRRTVLGILVNPSKIGEASDCEQWLYCFLSQGVYICYSDLCDYEVRKSLILETQKKPHLQSLENLNALREIIDFLPVSSSLLVQASFLWALMYLRRCLTPRN